MKEMTAMNVITLMPSTKQQQIDFSNQIIRMAQSGEINPLELDIYLKSIEDTIKIIRSNNHVKIAAIDEIDNYPDKVVRLLGAEITKVNRAKYEFEDSKHKELTDKMKAIKEEIKERETFLKSIKEPVADVDTGEIITPPLKRVTEYLKITFK